MRNLDDPNMMEPEKYVDAYRDWIISNLDKREGKTQSKLAEALGIAHPQITQMITGKRKIQLHEIPKIAEFLNVRPPFHVPMDKDFMEFLRNYDDSDEKTRGRMLRMVKVALQTEVSNV